MELKYNNIDFLNKSISVLPQEDKEKLKSILSENFYKKGEIISSVKEIEEHIYIISQGGARVFYLKDGKEITFSFAFDQDLILCLNSQINKPELPKIIEFLEDSHVITININLFSQPLKIRDITTAQRINRILLDYSYFLEERIINLQCRSARERYEWVVTRYPRLLQRATLGQIASFLGITQETISRIRSEKYPL